MKKITQLLFLITTIFSISSCSSQKSYENVAFYFNRENHIFYIDYDKDGKVDNTTTADKVHIVPNTWFYNEKGEKVVNEFFVGTRVLYIYD